MLSVPACLPIVVILWTVIVDASRSCPWRCSCLLKEPPITVNCSGLSLSNFPTDVDTTVQQLDLTSNFIQIIPNLDNYTSLEFLYLAHNLIEHISATSFNKLTNLEYLDLSKNLFTKLEQINAIMLLQSLVRLKTLKLSHNPLKTFTGQVNQMRIASSSLEALYLSSCDIAQVNGEALLGFTRLQSLDLSSNRIKWLDDLSSSTLTTLDLSYCDIDSMKPNALHKLPSLTTLKLSGNTQFAVNYGNLTSASLQVFEAENCSLTMPGLHGFPSLTYANLRRNKIVTLHEKSFLKNKLLVELDISANEISDIHPQAFVGARELTFINLSANSLYGSLPSNIFSTNYNLMTLDLSMNRLQIFGNLSILMLKNLDLSHCLIKELKSDCLKSLPWLSYLNLAHNPIEQIPDNIQSWWLQNLDLSYCRLSSITNDTFKRLPEIKRINLEGNRFTNPFTVDMFVYNERLNALKLANNPWICDCNSQEFKALWEFLILFPAKVTELEKAHIKCMSPVTVAGKSWTQACGRIWYPYDEPETELGFTHYGTALVLLVVAAAGIFAVVGVIKQSIKRRMKREQEATERELGHIGESHSGVIFQERENLDVGSADSSDVSERGRTASQLTQPPTYEEVMEMLRASREDIVSTAEVDDGPANDRHTQPVKSNRIPEQSREFSADSDNTDDEDTHRVNTYRETEQPRELSTDSDGSDDDRRVSTALNRHK